MDRKQKKKDFIESVASRIVMVDKELERLKAVYDESVARLKNDLDELKLREEAYKKLK